MEVCHSDLPVKRKPSVRGWVSSQLLPAASSGFTEVYMPHFWALPVNCEQSGGERPGPFPLNVGTTSRWLWLLPGRELLRAVPEYHSFLKCQLCEGIRKFSLPIPAPCPVKHSQAFPSIYFFALLTLSWHLLPRRLKLIHYWFEMIFWFLLKNVPSRNYA